ncbi:MAG: SpoIIE family protein phosphatase, partial [Bacteroidota bacterium]
MGSIENILSKYRIKLLAPFTLLLMVIVLINFYFVFEITPQPNDECIWYPKSVSKDSVGFFFESVKFEGVTWNAGIRDGDQLIAINDKVIKNLSDASLELNRMDSGDSAKYTIMRNNQLIETKVVVKRLIQFGGLAFAILAIIWLAIGFIVIKAKPQGKTQIVFFRIGVILIFYSSFNMLITQNIRNPLFDYIPLVVIVDQLWTIGAIFLPFLILKFFWIFPNEFKFYQKKWIEKLLFFLPLTAYIFITVFKIAFIYSGVLNPFKFYGVLAFINFVTLSIAAIVGLISLFVNYLRLENKKDRISIFIILISYTITILAVTYILILTQTTNSSVMYNQPEYFAPIILIAIIPLAFGYSIFKYSLMDVSDVIKTTVLYGAAMVGVVATYFLAIYLLGQSLSNAIGTEYQVTIAGIIFVVFALVFQSTKDRFQNLITKKFYPEQFAYQKVLLKFSGDVVTILGLENILKSTTNTIVDSLKLAIFGILLKNSQNSNYELKDGVGFKDENFNLIIDEEKLFNFLSSKQKSKQFPVIEDSDFPNIFPEAEQKLINEGIYTIIPLIIKSKVIGLLLFGLKYSGSRFAGKDIELLLAAANQTAVAIENARLYELERKKLILDHDLDKAREIQKSLLPDVIPHVNGLEISGTMIPAMQVGGDYFDVIKISNTKVFVIVGDVSGKGLSASFYMSKLQTMTQLYCNEHSTPKDILVKINQKIYSEIEKNWFITCSIAMIDTEEMSMTVCRAGHPPVIKTYNDSTTEITPEGIGIGLEKGDIFKDNLEELKIDIQSGDLYSFYSDGVTEAMNKEKKFFGDENFQQLLKSSYTKGTEQLQNEIINSISLFRDNAEQNDDITFILV